MPEQIELAEEKNEAKEFAELFKPLKGEQKATVKGIMMGLNMAKDNEQSKKESA